MNIVIFFSSTCLQSGFKYQEKKTKISKKSLDKKNHSFSLFTSHWLKSLSPHRILNSNEMFHFKEFLCYLKKEI